MLILRHLDAYMLSNLQAAYFKKIGTHVFECYMYLSRFDSDLEAKFLRKKYWKPIYKQITNIKSPDTKTSTYMCNEFHNCRTPCV